MTVDEILKAANISHADLRHEARIAEADGREELARLLEFLEEQAIKEIAQAMQRP